MKYSLPKDWKWIALGTCCEVISGATPRRDSPEYWNGEIRWVTPKELSGLEGIYLHETEEQITQAGYDSCSTTMLPKEAVLFSSRAPIGLVAITAQPMCTNQGFKSLVPNESVDSKYLYYCLRRFTPVIQAQGTGSTFKEISKRIFEKIEIPLPPLPVQRRIAAVLDKADALRQKRRRALAKLDDLLQAVFLDMFGDPVTNPKGWDIMLFGEVCSSQLGKMLSKKARQGKNPIPYLRNASVQWRSFDLSDLPEMDFSEDELAKFDLQPGDILVCEGGEVGRCAIWQNQLKLCSFQKALHRVRPDASKATPEYIQEYFFWMANRGGLDDATSQATIAHLTGVKLKNLPLPLPPIELQKKFSAFYKALLKSKKLVNSSLDNLDSLFNALLQKAFTGELAFAEDAMDEVPHAQEPLVHDGEQLGLAL